MIETLAIVSAVFFVAGVFKGIVGFGLPAIVLGLLTIPFGVHDAMILLLAPSFTTNFWQAINGRRLKQLFHRFFFFFFFAVLTIFFSVQLRTYISPSIPTILLGSILFSYAALNLLKVKIPLIRRGEPIISPVLGALNGVVTGVTGIFIMPAVLYFQALQIGRTELVQLLGILFLISTIALAISIEANFKIPPQLRMLSFYAIVPTMIGMHIGLKFSNRISEKMYKRFFFIGLLALGTYIISTEVG